ncbi:hypothetical protein [Mycolicibacter sinensis]|uniref:Uncharacterized protein n=1 Tax=Mycolicibacter sinensis (strain JDM601) TaxID=875328 RepID=A0A1A3TUP4_MYCSD|nr:hypothetical protein [Mycolicibacter sinensis]OBK86359.1 hypothetical protein A5648_05940 [Mycolicibacter sinensis]
MAAAELSLRQFLRTCKHALSAQGALAETEQALDKWTIIACQALNAERHDIVRFAIKVLHEAYVALPLSGVQVIEKRLAVAVRLYVVGSLAVRLAAWESLRSIVLQAAELHSAKGDYVHSSWIRHAHVEAARAGLTNDDDSGAYLISASRRLAVSESSMRPDLPDAAVTSVNPSPDDALLNSLCQFDILYCLLVSAEGVTSAKSMYPSSASFDEYRADPALVLVADDGAVRASLFPASDDRQIAAAMHHLLRKAMTEAMRFGGRWWGPPPSVQTFLTTNGQQPA